MARWEIFPSRMTLAPSEPSPFEPFEVEGTSVEIDAKMHNLRLQHPGVTIYAAEKDES